MGGVVTRINDNLMTLSDNLRIKFSSIVLNCSDPWESNDKTLKVVNRVLRWELKLEYITDATKMASTSSIKLGPYELLRLEELIPTLFLGTWFKKCFSRNDNGEYGISKKDEFVLITQTGDPVGFLPAIDSNNSRGVVIKTKAFGGFISESKLYELLYFIKKFDPYTYTNVTSLGVKILFPLMQQNNKSNFFKQTPIPTIATDKELPKNKKGRMIGDQGGKII